MADAGQEKIVMEIEALLKEDRDGALKSSVASGIDEQLRAINAALRQGVPPDQYQEHVKLKDGLESANLILDRAWSSFHR